MMMTTKSSRKIGCVTEVKLLVYEHLWGWEEGSKRSLSLRTQLHEMQRSGKTYLPIEERKLSDFGRIISLYHQTRKFVNGRPRSFGAFVSISDSRKRLSSFFAKLLEYFVWSCFVSCMWPSCWKQSQMRSRFTIANIQQVYRRRYERRRSPKPKLH